MDGGYTYESREVVQRMWPDLDNWQIQQSKTGDLGKYPAVKINELDDEGRKFRRDIGQILNEMKIPGYSPDAIKKLMFPPIRQPTERELILKNRELKAEM